MTHSVICFKPVSFLNWVDVHDVCVRESTVLPHEVIGVEYSVWIFSLSGERNWDTDRREILEWFSEQDPARRHSDSNLDSAKTFSPCLQQYHCAILCLFAVCQGESAAHGSSTDGAVG